QTPLRDWLPPKTSSQTFRTAPNVLKLPDWFRNIYRLFATVKLRARWLFGLSRFSPHQKSSNSLNRWPWKSTLMDSAPMRPSHYLADYFPHMLMGFAPSS